MFKIISVKRTPPPIAPRSQSSLVGQGPSGADLSARLKAADQSPAAAALVRDVKEAQRSSKTGHAAGGVEGAVMRLIDPSRLAELRAALKPASGTPARRPGPPPVSARPRGPVAPPAAPIPVARPGHALPPQVDRVDPVAPIQHVQGILAQIFSEDNPFHAFVVTVETIRSQRQRVYEPQRRLLAAINAARKSGNIDQGEQLGLELRLLLASTRGIECEGASQDLDLISSLVGDQQDSSVSFNDRWTALICCMIPDTDFNQFHPEIRPYLDEIACAVSQSNVVGLMTGVIGYLETLTEMAEMFQAMSEGNDSFGEIPSLAALMRRYCGEMRGVLPA